MNHADKAVLYSKIALRSVLDVISDMENDRQDLDKVNMALEQLEAASRACRVSAAILRKEGAR